MSIIRIEHLRGAAVGVLLLFSVGATACATLPQGTTTKGARDTITLEELIDVAARDAYNAIEILRPMMLRGRGVTSYMPGTPMLPEVFVDGMYFGPLESLHLLEVGDLAEVRWLDIGAAAVAYGEGHMAGVIDIRTRR
jgi:hypothetical protein